MLTFVLMTLENSCKSTPNDTILRMFLAVHRVLFRKENRAHSTNIKMVFRTRTCDYTYLHSRRIAAFKHFAEQVAQARLDGDRDRDKALIAEMMKFIGNSSYRRMITNKEKHHNIVYVDESEISTKIIDNHFYDMTELPDGYYEMEKTKKKINLDLPIHIGVFILNYAKLHMLEFYYDCVDKYLSCEDFEYSEMETDSAYTAISEELIKPDLREEFENDKHNWFVTPLAPKENVVLDSLKSSLKETK